MKCLYYIGRKRFMVKNERMSGLLEEVSYEQLMRELGDKILPASHPVLNPLE